MIDDLFKRRPRLIADLTASEFRPDFEALATFLRDRGHRRRALRGYLTGAAHLIHCLGGASLSLETMTRQGLRLFAVEHTQDCRCGPPYRVTKNFCSVAPHLFDVMVKRRGIEKRNPPVTPVDVLLSDFVEHLRAVRGLRQITSARYARNLRPVLAGRFGRRAVDFTGVSVRAVREWVSTYSANRSARTTHGFVTALRSLFRFLMFSGTAVGSLLKAVPMVRSYRLSNLPGGLDEQQLATLLGAIDVGSAIGLRTRAMVLCSAMLGLRAGEVANLRLEDLDWRMGTVRLGSGKGRRAAVLPLPRAVGRALVAYLKRGRPSTTDRHVFVRHYFPEGLALQSKDVSSSVRRAFGRAGLQLPSMGAHVLRHTAATRLVRAGAKMKEVADLLRHRDIDTTRIYTKVDLPRLAEVALPWPAEVA